MSTKQISQKKLKAIVFTDMADFTKISAQDEQKALDLIQKQNDIIKPIVEKYNGEWLKEIGDGLLFSFDSSLEAVRCSIEIQEALKDIDDLNLRIGIHQGDIFLKDGDVFGDDVNITSRIESFSPIRGICISEKVYQDISSIPEIKSEYIGYKRLKGLEHEMKLRCISSNNLPRHKFNKLPYYTGLFLMTIGWLTLIMGLLMKSLDIYLTLSRGTDFYEGVSYVSSIFTGMTCILVGYSNRSFVRGISYKAQRNFVLLGIIMTIYVISRFMLILFSNSTS